VITWVIMDKGAAVAEGGPRDLIAQHAPGFVGIFAREDEHRLQPWLPKTAQVFQQGWQTCVRAATLENLTAMQVASGIQPLQLRPANLEDVYLKLTGQALGDNE